MNDQQEGLNSVNVTVNALQKLTKTHDEQIVVGVKDSIVVPADNPSERNQPVMNKLVEKVKSLETLSEELNKSQEALKEKVIVINEKIKVNETKIEELKKRIEQLTDNSKQLNDLLASTKEAGESINAEGAGIPVLSVKDSEVYEDSRKMSEVSLKEILKKFECKADKDEVNKLANITVELKERLEKAIASFEKSNQEKEFARTSLNEMTNNSTIINQVPDFSITEKERNDYRNLLEKLNLDMERLLHDTTSVNQLKDKIIRLEALMETKLDKEQFNRWLVDNNLNQILSGLAKKFANRNEMVKALKRLEARVITLEELMREDEGDNAESALIAKKPLGGWSCASCQRDIINLEGMRTQYYP
jgi:DNA repair exonuclease SbcCD ATPase subunit